MLKKISFALAVSAAMFLSATFAYADSPVPLSGYAWSSNIGWLSFNSSDGATVSLSTTTPCSTTAACLTGYAWSSNIGWVKFGGLAGQSVNGMTTSDAIVNMSTGAVSGWARACAGTSPGDCSTLVSRTDGWDGWIELAGTNHLTVTGLTGTATSSTGVSFNPSNNQFSGYAWGSDVVGWLSFNTGSSGNNNPPVCVGTTCNPPPSSNLNISCNNGASLGTVPSAGGNETALIGNVSVNGGTGPYQYRWSPNSIIGPWTAWSSSNATLSYSSISATTTYSVYVQAEDFANATSSQIVCGTVTVNGTSGNNNPTQADAPVLWIHTSTANDTACVTGFNNNNGSLSSCITQTTIRTNGSATVAFSWPTSGGMTCLGKTLSPTPAGWQPNSWYNASLGLINGIGSVSFTQMANGVYKVYMSCSTPQTKANFFMTILDNLFGRQAQAASAVNSNPVEIDVVSSSIHEK